MSDDAPARAALVTLIVLQVTMLGALFTQTAPHPPAMVPIAGMGPFLGAALSAAAAALVLGPTGSRSGLVTSCLAAALALLSFGPQKWVDPAIAGVWPAVLTAQIAVVVLAIRMLQAVRHRQAPDAA
ncbi:MAG: hypothetical protein AAGL24_28210 [Pseudomonadota bacterium]